MIKLEKSILRQHIKEIKKSTSKMRLENDSILIMQRLERHPLFNSSNTILLYHSLPDEPNTHTLIEKWYLQKTILLPVIDGTDLIVCKYTGIENTNRKNAYSILEPSITNKYTTFEQIDLAIIPGVAFDSQGFRLGRGKGYYDKLFSDSRLANIYKIGVCFDFQKLKFIPTQAWDLQVNEVI